jgi:CheY-like chemotaxis protein
MKPVILVVEDNERNRKLVRTILEFRGYEVVECDDGEPSLALA